MTTLIIITMLVFSYLLIATGHLTGVNKSAIAVFLATIGWVLYVCWGSGFVAELHPNAYAEYLTQHPGQSEPVKYFIYENVFLKYVGQAAAIVLFMLATMSIIEISHRGFVHAIPTVCCGLSHLQLSFSRLISTR